MLISCHVATVLRALWIACYDDGQRRTGPVGARDRPCLPGHKWFVDRLIDLGGSAFPDAHLYLKGGGYNHHEESSKGVAAIKVLGLCKISDRSCVHGADIFHPADAEFDMLYQYFDKPLDRYAVRVERVKQLNKSFRICVCVCVHSIQDVLQADSQRGRWDY